MERGRFPSYFCVLGGCSHMTTGKQYFPFPAIAWQIVGHILAMKSTGPWPITSTCFSLKSRNILSGECDITTCSSLTSTPSHVVNCSAFFFRSVLPALVTKTVGTRNLPSLLISLHITRKWCFVCFLCYLLRKLRFCINFFCYLWNAYGADGSIFFPRTITPSISNRMPKSGSWVSLFSVW